MLNLHKGVTRYLVHIENLLAYRANFICVVALYLAENSCTFGYNKYIMQKSLGAQAYRR